MKKLLLATLFGGVGMWVLGGLWHNLIMANLYEKTHATHDGVAVLLLANLILALMMSYLYDRISKKGSYIWEGIKFGAFIGLLWVFPHGLAMVGAHDASLIYLIKNSAWHIVEQGFGGLIIAFVYDKVKRL